ncbi:MAG: M24 family metallopeptidase [bacterium]|nr:M24 family metallopeptidase [bacterium]
MKRQVLSLREQANIENNWLNMRIKEVLPQLMRAEGLDMWIVSAREYNEDPMMTALLPATMLSARRRTILVFSLQDELRCLSLSRTKLGTDTYEAAWDPQKEDQGDCLKRKIRELDPKNIGINYSETFAFGDGLSHTEYLLLLNSLDDIHQCRLRSAERLCIRFLEHRTKVEMTAYGSIVDIAHQIIAEAFSRDVIHPGLTTADDVAWWMRQRLCDLGLTAWFHPTVDIQRRSAGAIGSNEVIIGGDLLHCDVGFHYLGLATDTQQNAYVLNLDESDAPEGLRKALEIGNRLQDILAEEFIEMRTGNEILQASLTRANALGIVPSIYTHPIGFHGHGAGPTIGLWDNQNHVPGRGDYPLYNDTCHAMELNILHRLLEWQNQEIRLALEQTILFSQGKVHYLSGRQTKLFLV